VAGGDPDRVAPGNATTRRRTGMTPGPNTPSRRAAAYETSMMRRSGSLNGPRSLMRSSTPLPSTRLSTQTRVSKGKVRCAAVIWFMS
jgi:hypothetical protein